MGFTVQSSKCNLRLLVATWFESLEPVLSFWRNALGALSGALGGTLKFVAGFIVVIIENLLFQLFSRRVEVIVHVPKRDVRDQM